jgi:hypothetical protein
LTLGSALGYVSCVRKVKMMWMDPAPFSKTAS